MIYGYCRVSTKHQRITRQVTNITELYPEATVIKEFYTGTTQNRPRWEWLMKQIRAGDTIVFDSVSRISRNAEEGFKDYKMLCCLYKMDIYWAILSKEYFALKRSDIAYHTVLHHSIGIHRILEALKILLHKIGATKGYGNRSISKHSPCTGDKTGPLGRKHYGPTGRKERVAA